MKKNRFIGHRPAHYPGLVAVLQGPGRIRLQGCLPVSPRDIEAGKVYDLYYDEVKRLQEVESKRLRGLIGRWRRARGAAKARAWERLMAHMRGEV